MTTEELRTQLITIGITCRIQRNEVAVETCKFCGNTRWNLELNAMRGIYHCWACHASGRLDKLLHEWLGDTTIHIPVVLDSRSKSLALPQVTKDFNSVSAANVTWATQYLRRRGLGIEDIRRYGLMVCTTPTHKLSGRLVIPMYDFWGATLLGYVGRSITGKHPKYLTTMERKYITGYRATTGWDTPCVLVEGPFDGIAVHRASYHVAVLSGTANPMLLEFVSALPQETPVVILLDGAAQDEASTIYWSLKALCRTAPIIHVELPLDFDPADFSSIALKAFITRFTHVKT